MISFFILANKYHIRIKKIEIKIKMIVFVFILPIFSKYIISQGTLTTY